MTHQKNNFQLNRLPFLNFHHFLNLLTISHQNLLQPIPSGWIPLSHSSSSLPFHVY
jgi:hypothetical protein